MRETTSIEFERIDLAPRHHAAEVRGLVRLDAVVVHDVERIALLAHVEAGERAPRAADGVERPLGAAGEHGGIGEMLGGDLLGLLQRLFRRLLEPQPAEREGLADADLALANIDDLEAAAAEIAGDAVGIVDAGDDAESGQPRLLGAGEELRPGRR